MEPEFKVVRGKVVTPETVIADALVITCGPEIAWVGEAKQVEYSDYAQVAVGATAMLVEGYILPGLVDVHCHGGGGVSFPDAATMEEAVVAVNEHRKHGTTTMLASLVTASPEVLRQQAAMLTTLARRGEIAGIHFEGPFVSEQRCGAQNPTMIQDPNPAFTQELLDICQGYAATMTVAPEKEGILGPDGVAEVLINAGALPSYGHTDADPKVMRRALQEARAILKRTPQRRAAHISATHLFNGMAPIHHRNPGGIMELLVDAARGGVIVELIADGIHLSSDIVRSVYELVGREQIVFVTDAMAAAGMGDGSYELGALQVNVKNGIARLAKGDSIAGGTAHLIDVVRTSVAAGISLVDAVYCASVSGAKLIGDNTIGSLHQGKRADLVIVTEELHPERVMRNGNWVGPEN